MKWKRLDSPAKSDCTALRGILVTTRPGQDVVMGKSQSRGSQHFLLKPQPGQGLALIPVPCP